LRAQLLQVFYSIRSERLLMEQLDYNILFRWFVGLESAAESAVLGFIVGSASGTIRYKV